MRALPWVLVSALAVAGSCKRSDPPPTERSKSTVEGAAKAAELPSAGVPSASSGSVAQAAPSAAFWRSVDGGWIGVEVQGNPGGGARIASVVPGSNAAAADLREADVILTIAGAQVSQAGDVAEHASAALPGTKIAVSYERAGQTHTATVTLERIPSKGELMRRRFVGRDAPELLELSPVPGQKSRTVPSLRGKATVLEFWASWCPPCHLLSKVLHGWQVSGVGTARKQVLGIGADTPEVAARAAREMHMTYPLFLDRTGKVTRAYRVSTLPTLFVIDSAGVVRDVVVGYDEGQLKQAGELFEKLAREPAPTKPLADATTPTTSDR